MITLKTRFKKLIIHDEYQELKPSRPYSLPIFRGSNNSDSKNQLEFVTAIPTPDSEEDAHYVVACESYMEEEPQNSEEW
jgi:hypothetical protein